jgi:Glycosyltransferase WbsX
MAETSGLPGLYIAGIGDDGWKPQTDGFDAKIVDHGFSTRPWGSLRHPVQRLRHKIQFLRSIPTVQSYRKYAEVEALTTRLDNDAYQCVVHAWDNTPRSGRLGLVLEGSTPDLFGALFRRAVKALQNRPPETRILFLKSWNEWAEGNHLEPDLRYGHAYLNVIREIIFD